MIQEAKANINQNSYMGEGFISAAKAFIEHVKENTFRSWGYINAKSPNVVKDFKETAVSEIKKKKSGKCFDEVVVLCIGSDFEGLKADNVGPLVGSKLLQKDDIQDIYVYGTMDDPIYGPDSARRIEDIYENHPSSLIIDVGVATSCYKWQTGRIHVGEGEGNSTDTADIYNLEVSPILIHRTRKDTDRDVWWKVSELDGYTVNRMAEVTANCIYSALWEMKNQGLIISE